MSRITIVTSHPTLSQGGHLVITHALERALREAGHEAAILYTPEARFGALASAYWSTWRADVRQVHSGRPVDQVISLRFPSYAVRHVQHTCWLNHRMREYYDRWESFKRSLSGRNVVKERVRRQVVHACDRYLLTRQVDRMFAQSKTIQKRLAKWGGVSSKVLYPPPPQRQYRSDGYEDYLFVVSRLTPLKRIGLILESLNQPETAGVRCLIAGDGEERDVLQMRIEHLGMTDRVKLLGRLSETELLSHLSRCRAVCFPPLAEDYGFVTVEAFASKKAVITCFDSGGPAELVEHGVNGLVCSPTASALAVGIQTLMDDKNLAERYGSAGHVVAKALNWEEVVARLVVS